MSDTLTKSDIATLEWWTCRECANRWRISESTVIRWLESGRLVGKRFGRQWRISTAAIDAFERDGVPQVREPTPAAAPGAEWQNLPDYGI